MKSGNWFIALAHSSHQKGLTWFDRIYVERKNISVFIHKAWRRADSKSVFWIKSGVHCRKHEEPDFMEWVSNGRDTNNIHDVVGRTYSMLKQGNIWSMVLVSGKRKRKRNPACDHLTIVFAPLNSATLIWSWLHLAVTTPIGEPRLF
jgi:hypothetical protein